MSPLSRAPFWAAAGLGGATSSSRFWGRLVAYLFIFIYFLVVLQTGLNEMIHSRLVSSAVVLILQSLLTHLYYYLFALAFGTFSAFLLVQPVADDKNALKLHYKDRSWYK